MKRSTKIALVSMGAAAVTYAGLRDTTPTSEAYAFRTVEDCVLAPGVGEGRCREEYAQALAEHERTAPRYEERSACEAEFGADACEQRPSRSAGGPPVWAPLLAGYLFGQANAARPFASQPLYPGQNPCPPNGAGIAPQSCAQNPTGARTSYRTGHGVFVSFGDWSRSSGSGAAARTSTVTVPRTVASPPPSRPATVARGGFGTTARAVSVAGRGTGS